MRFRRFGKSPQGTDLSPLSLCRFTKNYKSHTAITSIVDSAHYAQNPGENKSVIASRFAESAWQSTLFSGLESNGLEEILLFAKAKRSKNFFKDF